VTFKGVGISIDQKLTNAVGLFARYGTQDLDDGCWITGARASV
jgi:hypothetical protein